MLNSSIESPLEGINRIDPNLTAIALILILVVAVLYLIFFMPRLKEIDRLTRERNKFKAQRDGYINELSIELISKGHTKEEVKAMLSDMADEYENKIKAEQGRTKQASDRSKVFAFLGEKFRRLTNV